MPRAFGHAQAGGDDIVHHLGLRPQGVGLSRALGGSAGFGAERIEGLAVSDDRLFGRLGMGAGQGGQGLVAQPLRLNRFGNPARADGGVARRAQVAFGKADIQPLRRPQPRCGQHLIGLPPQRA